MIEKKKRTRMLKDNKIYISILERDFIQELNFSR